MRFWEKILKHQQQFILSAGGDEWGDDASGMRERVDRDLFCVEFKRSAAAQVGASSLPASLYHPIVKLHICLALCPPQPRFFTGVSIR